MLRSNHFMHGREARWSHATSSGNENAWWYLQQQTIVGKILRRHSDVFSRYQELDDECACS